MITAFILPYHIANCIHKFHFLLQTIFKHKMFAKYVKYCRIIFVNFDYHFYCIVNYLFVIIQL